MLEYRYSPALQSAYSDPSGSDVAGFPSYLSIGYDDDSYYMSMKTGKLEVVNIYDCTYGIAPHDVGNNAEFRAARYVGDVIVYIKKASVATTTGDDAVELLSIEIGSSSSFRVSPDARQLWIFDDDSAP